MSYSIDISDECYRRWLDYWAEAPSWLNPGQLAEALLNQHFDEAARVRESIFIQESGAKHRMQKKDF